MIQGLEHLVGWRSLEDWLHYQLAAGLTGTDPPVEVVTRMRDGQPYPFVTVRQIPYAGSAPKQPDLFHYADVEIHCLAEGIDAESDAYQLACACETLLRQLEGKAVGPTEKVFRVTVTDPPARRSDWADAQSTVQYHDLPVGVERYRLSARLKLARRNKPQPTP